MQRERLRRTSGSSQRRTKAYHVAFTESRNLLFPLLADFEPKGKVAREYGVYRDEDGTAERALFVINADGVVTWSYLSPVDVNPGAAGILDALESFAVRSTAHTPLTAEES